MIKLTINTILFIIAWALMPIVELVTFIFVVFKYGKGSYDYFDDVAYNFDVISAGRNRTLWNVLFVRQGGLKFKKGTDMSISRVLGINEWLNQLTWFGWFIVYLLWAIDIIHWFNGGHCFQSIKAEDFELPEVIEFIDGSVIYKNKK